VRLYILVTVEKDTEQVMGITSDTGVVRLWTKLEGNEYYTTADYLETELGTCRVMETWEQADRSDEIE